MNRRDTVQALLALGAAGASFASFAQKKDRVRRVGSVHVGTRIINVPYLDAFLAGMKDYGYVAGRDLIVESRYAQGDPARYLALVDEILALKPDVLLGSSAAIAIAMKSKTTTVPIVLCTVSDAVGTGLAQSLARPGGNVTGISLQLHELSAKHIEIMKELLPRMRRAALLIDLSQPNPLSEQYERIATTAAAAKGISLDVFGVDNPEDIRRAFRQMETKRAEALLLNPSPRFNALRGEIIKGAAKARIPDVWWEEVYSQDGGLVSYGPSFLEAYRRVAYFVDRILKGAKPGDLPIEQPTKFSLMINARTAKLLGIKIPDAILLRADRVIE